MGTLWQDLRYAVRLLLKRPGFTATAVLVLALGIGANTAIFSVVNAALLRPLPYRDAERLTLLYETNARVEGVIPAAPANFLAWRGGAHSFEDLAALSNKGWSSNLTGAGEPERLQGFQVTANLFPLLGAAPALGRGFLPEEDRPGAEPVVVLSHGLWQRYFGGAADVLGKTLTLNGEGHTVVGVMPQEFQFFRKADVWTPVAFDAAEENNLDDHYLVVLGRLRPGVSAEQAGDEAAALLRARAANPDEANGVRAVAAQESLVREVRPVLVVLLAAVGFVLLIACANIANLTLARAASRRKEIAIRSALGASRARVVRQLLTESMLLAFMGGAAGLLLAMWVVDFLVGGLPGYLLAGNPRLGRIGVDAWMLGFTLLVSLAASLFFGLAPAVLASRTQLTDTLKEGGKSSRWAARGRLRAALVVAETALALVLLVGAGLMIKSLWLINSADPGFDPSGVLAVSVDLPATKYKDAPQIAEFYRQAVERLSALPGVESVGAVSGMGVSSGYEIDGRPPESRQQRPLAMTHFVTPGYFKALRVPLRGGRTFNEQDRKDAPPVAVIDETVARRRFPDEDPLGKRITVWGASREIVGVVGATKFEGRAEAPNPRVYLPYTQMSWSGMTLFVRSSGGTDASALAPAVRGAILSIDGEQPVYGVGLLEETFSEATAPQRYSAGLLGAFAALALVLAAVGLYGVIAYSVAERTHEIGVRVALGAQRRDILSMVLRQGMRLALAGLALGIAAALLLTRLMESLLYGVSATDPTVFAAIALLLAAVALLACYLPARRATKVDPMVALRYE